MNERLLAPPLSLAIGLLLTVLGLHGRAWDQLTIGAGCLICAVSYALVPAPDSEMVPGEPGLEVDPVPARPEPLDEPRQQGHERT